MYSTAITVISSSFPIHFVLVGALLDSVGVWPPPLTDVYIQPKFTQQTFSEPRNCSETFEAPSSSDIQKDFAFQEE